MLRNQAHKSRPKTLQIFLVEDNPADAKLLETFLDNTAEKHDLLTFADGEAALNHLSEQSTAKKPRPDLVILDLNLPKVDGKDVLRRIRADKHFRSVPVIVLSTSERDEDVHGCYELGANCFLTKPNDLDEMNSLFHSLHSFWFNHVRLPNHRLD